jgi:hypothetical protein
MELAQDRNQTSSVELSDSASKELLLLLLLLLIPWRA